MKLKKKTVAKQQRLSVSEGNFSVIGITGKKEAHMFEIVDTQGQEAVIKVIGVGGCGGNAVDI